jgi:hypothetical protein
MQASWMDLVHTVELFDYMGALQQQEHIAIRDNPGIVVCFL